MMDNLFQLLAAVCSGVAVTSCLLLVFSLCQKVQVDTADRPVETEKRLPVLFRIFLPFASNLSKPLRNPVFQEQLKQTRNQILMAGYDSVLQAEEFMAVRLLMMIVGTLLTVFMFASHQPAMALLLALIFFLYPQTWLNGVIRRRHLQILKALPNLLDLLTLSVEAGKDFLTALREITQRRKVDAISEELLRALHEIQLGKGRQQALREMSQRVQQPDLTSVISAIIQADELGVSIGQLLRIQGDQLRTKRFSRAEKLANEAPVKILFPVIIFIFPAVFIILMGPILLQAMQSMLGH